MTCSVTDVTGEPTVYTLLVVAGRWPADGLPDGAMGAQLLCYAAGADEAEAVRETVAVLRAAELKPLDVTSYGSLAERESEGEVEDEERELLARAGRENAVIVAEMTPIFGELSRAG